MLEARISALEAELAAHQKPADPAPAGAPETPALPDSVLDLFLQRLDPEYLWKAGEESGDLDVMEQYIELAEAIYRIRLAQADLPAAERKRIEQALDMLGFRKGYTHLAGGDETQAREDLRQDIESIDLREKELAAAGESLPAVSQIYRQRSRDVLEAIEELIGRPPSVDIDLGDNWVTAKRASLAGLRGKAVGIVFRSVGDQRSADFLGQLWRICGTNPLMEIVSISYITGNRSAEDQATDLRQELDRIGFKGAAGFEADAMGHSLFKRFKAFIGSATFLILDPAGKVVWFMQDPRGKDALFARKLLDRAGG